MALREDNLYGRVMAGVNPSLKYSPSQPRQPAGNIHGGEFAGHSGSTAPSGGAGTGELTVVTNPDRARLEEAQKDILERAKTAPSKENGAGQYNREALIELNTSLGNYLGQMNDKYEKVGAFVFNKEGQLVAAASGTLGYSRPRSIDKSIWPVGEKGAGVTSTGSIVKGGGTVVERSVLAQIKEKGYKHVITTAAFGSKPFHLKMGFKEIPGGSQLYLNNGAAGRTKSLEDLRYRRVQDNLKYSSGQPRVPGGPHGGEFSSGGGGGFAASAGPTEFSTAKEGTGFLNSHYGEYRKGLSKQESYAFAFYQSPSGYPLINEQLRGRNVVHADLPLAKKQIKFLDQALEKAPPLKKDTLVYRGFSMEQFGNLKPGSVIQDKGFVSTSVTKEGAGSFRAFGQQAFAKIILPKGTRAIGGSTKEMLLSRNSKFKISSIKKQGKTTFIEMELMP